MLPSKEVKNSSLDQCVSGVGLSARSRHYSDLMKEKRVPWLEFLLDNYLHIGSPRHLKLKKLAEIYPVVFHCVGFNLGSRDNIDEEYLARVNSLVADFSPAWVSDHLCFCGNSGHYAPDLLPISYDSATLELIQSKIEKIIKTLHIPFLVENVSLYIKFKNSRFSEEEFLSLLTEIPRCGILLDVNNLYVNSQNYMFDPFKAFLQLPLDKIKQIHLAGHTNYGDYIVDTHSESVQTPVMDLFKKIIKELGDVPVTVERDDNIPPFEEMMKEVNRVSEVYYG